MNDKSNPPASSLTPVASADSNLAQVASANPLVARGLADLASNRNAMTWGELMQRAHALRERLQRLYIAAHGAPHPKLAELAEREPIQPPSGRGTG